MNIRNIYINIVLLFVLTVGYSQPAILYTGLTSTTPSPTNNRFAINDLGLFRQVRFQSNQSVAASTTGWAYHIGTTAVPDYSSCWRPYTGGNTISLNTYIPTSFANGARFNAAAGGSNGLLPTITSGNYYTFNVSEFASDNPSEILETTYQPINLISQTLVAPITTNNGALLTLTTSATPNAGEYVFVRFSTDGFATSSIVPVALVGVTGTTTLPCFAGGTNVRYYYFSSNKTAAQLAIDVATYGQATAYDLATLSILNNGGSNYNYTQPFNNNFEGTYYIPSACYPSLASFITAINAGFVANNVIVNIAAGYTETAPATGFVLTANGGVAARSITFQKNGAGVNPTFTASGSLVAGAINDAVFKIVGGDYITVDGLTFLENSSNTIIASVTNNMVEFGIALAYNTISDGCQNVTLKNNTIDLNRTYANTFGIYSNNSHSVSAMTATANSLATQGTNNNLKITGNTITDVNFGICVVGSGNSCADHNDGLIIGGSSTEGNTITNFGTANRLSNYNYVTATSVAGILIKNTKNYYISYNTITSSVGGFTDSNLRGILINSAVQAPDGANLNTINNNNISLKTGSSTGDMSGIVIENLTSNNTSTLNVLNNNFTDCDATVSTTGGINFISNNQSFLNSDINYNTFSNLIINNASGSIYFINSNSVSLPVGGTKNVISNAIVGSFKKNVAGGNLYFYQDTGSSVAGSFVNNQSNNFSNITLTGTSSLFGWNNQDGGSASSPTKIIEGNSFTNLILANGTNTILAVNGFGDYSEITNNLIDNITGGTSAKNGIVTGNNSPGNKLSVSNNIIKNINMITSGNGAIVALTLGSPSIDLAVTLNTISFLKGNGSITAIASTNTAASIAIADNTILNLFTNAAINNVNLLGISNTVPAKINIFNNSIKTLKIKVATLSTGGALIPINCSTAYAVFGTITNITGNMIDDIVSDNTSNTHLVQGITGGGVVNYNISNNTITNMFSETVNSNENAFAGIVNNSISTNQYINNNTISNIQVNITSGSDTKVSGIFFNSGAGGGEICQNKISRISNFKTGVGATIFGIALRNSGVRTIANNMVSLINVNTPSAIIIYGISDLGNGTGTKKYLYNSVNIAGVSTGSVSTFAMEYRKNTGFAEIQNNIFQNVRTGTGKNYAITNIGANFTGVTFSNNIFYANNPSTIGLTTGSIDKDFATWNISSSGTNSFSSLTNFVNPIDADLHIDTTTCSDANNTGLPVTKLDDFDAEVRDLVTPDIGADEHTKASTIWNGTVWNPSAPTSSALAIIEGNYDMTLGVSRPSLDACSLIIRNNAKVTVSSGKYLNLENNLTVANNALLEIQDGGSYIQINNNGINTTGTTATISNFSAKRNANIRELDYVYWSAPVTAFPVSTISPSTPVSKIWNWNTIVANPNGGQGNWENISENMITGKGYIVRGPTAWNPTIPTTYSASFLGKPNNGICTPTIQRGSVVALATTGINGVVYSNFADNWNLIGNPYPSSISAASFLTANTNIEGAVRIWTHGILPISIQNPFYNSFVYNYTSNDYIVYNGTATTSGPTGFSGNIASGQGFFVVMNDGPAITDKVTFTNAMRNKTFANNQFYRSTNTTNNLDFETLEKHRIWLDLISESNQTIRTVVGYVDGATQEKDRLFDAYSSLQKEFNFFSLIGNEVMTIQGRSLPFENTDTIPMGIRVPTNGTYTIAIATSDGLFANNNQTIYLEDKLLNSIHNLSLAPYLFDANQGLFTDRFVLRYTDAALVKPSFETLSNSVSIFSSNNSIKINSTQENIINYIIYDVLGRILASGNNETKYIEINTIAPNNQPLIVKTTLENGQVITKKVIF